MKRKLIPILLVLACLFSQCTSNSKDTEGGSDYPSMETFAAIDSCMSYMAADPLKAHRMLDSLKEAKLMTEQRCDYYHAMVIYCGDNNLDSALLICDRLLDANDFGDDLYLEEEICVLASNITSTSNRHIETLKYANRGISLCHGNKDMREDEATLMGRVGVAEHALGRLDQARETYARAYSLLKESNSFSGLIALISLQKKQEMLYKDARDYDKAISICHDIIDMVNRFDRQPSIVEQRPETMQESGMATHSFADFYRCQMYAHIARAYRQKIQNGKSRNVQADKDSANAYVDKWLATDESRSPDDVAYALPELYFTGKKTEFAENKRVVEDLYRGDSLVSEYVDYLTLLADDASSTQDYKTSNSYLKRAIVLSDSIRQQELMRTLSEQMSLNMVQEQQLARQDAEYQLERQQLIIVLLTSVLIIMVIVALIISVLVHKNKESREIIETTQQDLTESMADIKDFVMQLEENKTEKNALNMAALYERIDIAMKENKLYLNPELDVKMLAENVNSCRSVVSTCINSITGKSFRSWLADYRLSLFIQMLEENPEASISDLAMQCGYKEQSTFRRQFKSVHGMTVGEYRNQILAQQEDRK